jgi:hypothetical protein
VSKLWLESGLQSNMTWFNDLSVCDYFGLEASVRLRAVGWLHNEHPFHAGRVEPRVYSRLVALLGSAWQPVVSAGFHECEMCLYDPARGHINLFIPHGDVVFVTPELVAHYMNAHGYAPPDSVCEAILNCPDMDSMQYKKMLVASGGGVFRSLFRSG